MRQSDKYPDYEDLTGFHLATSQIGELLRLKSVRATRGELSYREYLAELLELLSQAEDTFRFESLEPERSTARFGKQVEDVPGHVLFMPDEAYIERRREREAARSHPAAKNHLRAYERLLADRPEAFATLREDILEYSREFEQRAADREDLLDALLARLSDEQALVSTDGAGADGRIDFGDTFNDASGIGLFRPDREVMHEEPAPEPDPALGDVSVTEDGEAIRIDVTDVTLPDGGHVAAISTAGHVLAATDYLEAGSYDELSLALSSDDGTGVDVLLMLFKGEPDAPFDLSNIPYTAEGRPFRRELSL